MRYLVVAAVAGLVALSGGTPGGVTAQSGGAEGTATLTVQKARCPDNYAGDDLFADCFRNQVAGVAFTVSHAGGYRQTGTTGVCGLGPDCGDGFTNGTVIFRAVPAGNVTVTEEGLSGSDIVIIECTADGRPFTDVEQTDTGSYALDVPAGADVSCDWYNVAVDVVGTGERVGTRGSDGAGDESVRALPKTGLGVAVDDGVPSGMFGMAATLALIAGINLLRLRPAR